MQSYLSTWDKINIQTPREFTGPRTRSMSDGCKKKKFEKKKIRNVCISTALLKEYLKKNSNWKYLIDAHQIISCAPINNLVHTESVGAH